MATYSTCTVHVGKMGNSSSMWPHLVLVRADVVRELPLYPPVDAM